MSDRPHSPPPAEVPKGNKPGRKPYDVPRVIEEEVFERAALIAGCHTPCGARLGKNPS